MTKRTVQLAALAGLLVLTSTAAAEMPIPTASTPTLRGGQILNDGDFVLGLNTGWPQTSFDAFFGLGGMDVGVNVGITYGSSSLGGLQQRLGLNLQVPLRWTVIKKSKWVAGLKVSPYFMIGESGPSISVGADVGLLFDIPLPKIFKIIVGPELRTGLATPGSRAGYNGAIWANIGIETLISQEFFVGLLFHGGGHWHTDFGASGGLFRANIYAGMKL